MNRLWLRKNALCKTAFVMMLSASLYVLFRFNPATELHWIVCPFHKFTGFYCPGCGSMRAIHAILHGNIADALSYNIFTTLLLPYLFYELIIVRIFQKKPGMKLHPFMGYFIIFALLLFWILRNIPIHPFTLLAP